MKILITSGTSFLGGRIAKYFQSTKHEITIGYRSKSKKQSFFNNFKNVNINWHSIDSIRKACSDKDIVIHTAGLNNKECNNSPISAYEFNSLTSGNLGIACQKEEVKVFIYFSSIHVYSKNTKGIINEISACKTNHHYANSKYFAEKILNKISKLNSTKFIILRLANLFGYPYEENELCWELFVNNICKDASQNRRITVNSNPSENRNFISIPYLNLSLNYLIQNFRTFKNFEVFNITSKKTLTLEELTNYISESYKNLLNKQIIVSYKKQKSLIDKINYSSRLDSILKSDEGFESEIVDLIYYCENKYNIQN